MATDDDLMRITLFALEHDEFRQAWDEAIRENADKITAEIAGARMAGCTEGYVEVLACLAFPVPADIGQERTRAVFMRMVIAEVDRRARAMTSTGSFG